ncbi:response regulator [Brucepastera parasyntrophica]|uniref:ATP-binding response regulator n=1 Tax=Brucepastera parasyntrophica TaxID=2880008 RepID=UPI002109656D|nr:response regulator [Brucepastera parasyntrophica]ULQ60229.1 response regulator [Brucepastera parasyntrophica]
MNDNDQNLEELQKAFDAASWTNQAKSNFISHMAHDIRTRMNAIIGMTGVALANIDNRSKVQDSLKKISQSSTHLLELINDILDMSRIESGKMALINDKTALPAIIKNVVTIMQPRIKAKDQELNIRLHNVEHERLYCDFLRLNQVFINILSNAVKFTPDGGRITLDIEELPPREEGAAFFRFTCADTGIGMKPEFLKDIFSVFSRDTGDEAAEGSGMGMAICKTIIDMMGGTISVQSEEGKGSVFTVELSLKIADAPAEAMKLPALRILVVDDDTVTCETVSGTLASLGVKAEWTDKSRDAAEKVAAAKNEGRSYDAIIIDWHMRDMDGIETTKEIRKQVGFGIPILLTSVCDWADIEDEARKAGVNGFIAKPLFKSALFNGLKKYVLRMDETEKGSGYREVFNFTGKRILLVEDNEINQIITKELLADTGVVIDCAENGEEGVKLFAGSAENYYDLILMDIQMPVMNGYEATRQIRAMDRKDAKKVPVIAMTADAFSEDIDLALKAGMNSHIAKPIDPVRLKREIHKNLGRN